MTIEQVRPSHSIRSAAISVSACLLICWALSQCREATAQEQINSVRELAIQGTVEACYGDQLLVTDADGKTTRLLIQTDPFKPIMLRGNSIPLNAYAQIRVEGKLVPAALIPGMVVEVDCDLNSRGKVENVQRIRLAPPGSLPGGVAFESDPVGDGDFVPATISGIVKLLTGTKLTLSFPEKPAFRQTSLSLDISGVAEIEFVFDCTGMIRKGDIIRSLAATEVSTGDIVVRNLDVALVGLRTDPCLTVDQQLQIKYAHLPNDPRPFRDERSKHFLLRTDLSEQRTAILLDKLETMAELIGDYYGRRPSQPIQCVVVSNLANWNVAELPERALMKIRAGEGMTAYERIGRQQNTVVFSAANDNVVQHEAVHGFCFLVFDGTGPLWYAEGMAEVGRFWKPGDSAVNADPAIVGYLRGSEKQPAPNIINAATIDGELWKAYAWRWVLCHMLANNPNYAKRFHKFGLQALRDENTDFEKAFFDVANQVNFEYNHFLDNLDTGLRADLIAWDWKTASKPINAGRSTKTTIQAKRGWQPGGVIVEQGAVYEITADGSWQLDELTTSIDANGAGTSRRGQLVGVLMNDFQLGEEFELGTKAVWTAPASGILYLRCRETMALLADNSGSITVEIDRTR